MIEHVQRMEMLYEQIYEGNPWREHQLGRAQPHVSYRHLVRFLVYEPGKVSLKTVALAEALALNRPPANHASILNSVQVADRHIRREMPELFALVGNYHRNILEGRFRQRRNQNTKDRIYERWLRLSAHDRLEVIRYMIYNDLMPLELLERLAREKPAQPLLPLTPTTENTVETDNLTLTEDQLTALEDILSWFEQETDTLDSPQASLYKTLSGYAGTGKTTLLGEIVHAIEEGAGRKVAVTATTNKAVKVLRERIEAKNFGTIHSLLNIKPKQVGTQEIFEADHSQNPFPLSAFHLVIVDECSMISEKLLEIIYQENQGRTKVLFCGDPAQLQPIGEQISKCFEFAPSGLTQVVRHGDTIASKAKLVRDADARVEVGDLLADRQIMRIDKRGVWALFKDFRSDPDAIRMLCWTNKRVGYWNQQLRLADWGEPTEWDFSPGDIVIANKPCLEDQEIIMANSEEGLVSAVDVRESHFELKVSLFDGGSADVRVVRPEYRTKLRDKLNELADARQWRRYWRLRRHYHDVRHCYALTTHKSQGSTFGAVVIDWANLQNNPDLQNRNQLIYVALTRAAETVYIL